jgi:ABC-type polysaccharide/polyol phosphate export permease
MHFREASYMAATIGGMVKNREFIRETVLHEFRTRHRGSALGWSWLVLRPLLETAVYVAVISLLVRSALPSTGGIFAYAIYVLAGMIPWQILSKTLAEAPSLIRDRMEIVKQVIYPIEILPLNSLLFSMLGGCVTLGVYLVLGVVSGGLSWTIILIPVPMLLLVGFTIGISWAMMIVGIVLKDLREITAIFLGLLVYLSPVVATPALVGATGWRLIMLNPLAHIIICFRDVFQGQFHPLSWGLFLLITIAALFLGAAILMRARLRINEYI